MLFSTVLAGTAAGMVVVHLHSERFAPPAPFPCVEVARTFSHDDDIRRIDSFREVTELAERNYMVLEQRSVEVNKNY